jgi:hypothetical protein
VGEARVEEEVGQEGLGGAQGDLDRRTIQPHVKLPQQPDFEHIAFPFLFTFGRSGLPTTEELVSRGGQYSTRLPQTNAGMTLK